METIYDAPGSPSSRRGVGTLARCHYTLSTMPFPGSDFRVTQAIRLVNEFRFAVAGDDTDGPEVTPLNRVMFANWNARMLRWFAALTRCRSVPQVDESVLVEDIPWPSYVSFKDKLPAIPASARCNAPMFRLSC